MHKDIDKIAFILANIHSGSAISLLPAFVKEAEQIKKSIWLFPGGRIDAPDIDERLQNKIYEKVIKGFDGVVSWASSIGAFVNHEKLTAFHYQFNTMPIVTMSHEIPGIPSVSIDAYQAMFPLLEHFYRSHNIKEFAFIQGPAEHGSAQDRLKMFRDFHVKNNLSLREDLITSPYDWSEGEQAILELIDKRKLIPGKDFKALIASSDLQLYQAIQVLQRRGYVIPKDLLAGGFNNSLESQIAFPPFTTVHSPIKEQALFAIRELIKLEKIKEKSYRKYLHGSLIIRRSCGCIPILDSYKNIIKANYLDSDNIKHLEDFILIESQNCIKILNAEQEEIFAWINPLFESLENSVKNGNTVFIEYFETILERQINNEMDISRWQEVITHLLLASEQKLGTILQNKIKKYLDIARILLAEALVRSHQKYQWKMDKLWIVIRGLERDLINIQNRKDLSSILYVHLRELGITRAYVVEIKTDGKAVCIAGFDNFGPLSLDNALIDQSDQILPNPFFQTDLSGVWIVEPLVASKEFLGWACIKVGEPVASIYEEIRHALSKSIISLRHLDSIQRAQTDALKAEKLKSAFLANVSTELLQPLDVVSEEIVNILKLHDEDKLDSKVKEINEKLKRQKSLLMALIELSRAEVGDFDFQNRYITLLSLFSKNVQNLNYPENLNPLLYGDEEKLLRAFNLLSSFGLKNEIEINYTNNGINITFRNYIEDKEQINKYGFELETTKLLIQKIIAGHAGLVECIHDDTGLFWKMRFPFPCSEGVMQTIKSNTIYILGDSHRFENLKPYLYFNNVEYIWVNPMDLLKNINEQQNPGLLIIFLDYIDKDNMSIIYNILKNQQFRKIPFLLFPRTNEPVYVWDSIVSLLDQHLVDKKVGKKIVLYDLKKDMSDMITSYFANDPVIEIYIVDNSKALHDLYKEKYSFDLFIIPANQDIYDQIFNFIQHTVQNIPTLIICDSLLTSQIIDPILDRERLLLINDGIYTPDEFKSLVYDILLGSHFLSAYTGRMVKKTVLYLNEHLKDVILRWKLADYVHISEDYLSRIFKKEMALTPWDYIIRLRIHTSKILLKETSEQIAEIAENVGFSDQAYFCRVFKKIVGISPLAFRKKKQ
ncbi:helix-turn-helix domain-containing protein [Gracilinema caldarium]|uniref:Transcriptional regulator, AraC family n=1 Tax=Gracilinema caldarium (strain ATCC 51460 / DSM 7334 / H1) TaxID=744872 RepID=F8F1E2_GRAC1|nr:helix-turn-helix domain-containing protein [Gracilinema caldarium]AEJ18786.1 transcriptional regulator, AraC family [Gracilinema caldarium DSM 7334]